MLRRSLAGSVALLFLLAGSAAAQEEPEETEFGKIGGYAGIAGSYAVELGRGDIGDVMFDSGGVQLWLGYRLADVLALEVQGEWQDGLKELNGFTIGFNANWYPFSFFEPGSWFQPFAITGVGVISGKPPGKSSDFNGAFRVGGGFDVYLTNHWSVRIKTEWFTGVGKLSNITYAPTSLGFQYNW